MIKYIIAILVMSLLFGCGSDNGASVLEAGDMSYSEFMDSCLKGFEYPELQQIKPCDSTMKDIISCEATQYRGPDYGYGCSINENSDVTRIKVECILDLHQFCETVYMQMHGLPVKTI